LRRRAGLTGRAHRAKQFHTLAHSQTERVAAKTIFEMIGDITSNIYYLDRDERFQTEKPFSWSAELAFLPGLPPSNHIFTRHLTKIRDVRGRDFTDVDTQGFTFIQLPTSLKPEEMDNEALVEAIYYPEIEDMLWSQFPDISRIAFLGHQSRKRSPMFPHQKGALVTTAQPQTMAHADFTRRGALDRLKNHFKEYPELENKPWEMLNVWRVMRGPNNDWPLAMCDYRSIDADHDVIANDIVVAHGDGCIENSLLHHNKNHQWFYKSNMEVDDLIIFRQADSSGTMPRAWHASFEHPAMKMAPFMPRESIEVRLVVWRS